MIQTGGIISKFCTYNVVSSFFIRIIIGDNTILFEILRHILNALIQEKNLENVVNQEYGIALFGEKDATRSLFDVYR